MRPLQPGIDQARHLKGLPERAEGPAQRESLAWRPAQKQDWTKIALPMRPRTLVDGHALNLGKRDAGLLRTEKPARMPLDNAGLAIESQFLKRCHRNHAEREEEAENKEDCALPRIAVAYGANRQRERREGKDRQYNREKAGRRTKTRQSSS